MPQDERFEVDRLTEAELEQLRRFLELKGRRRPIILSPEELLTAKQARWRTGKNRKRLNQRDRD